jgi:signal transduction histidine kinase
MLKQIDQIGYAIENIGRILDFAQTYEAAGSQGLSWLKVDKAVDEAKKLVPSLDGIAVETENVDIEVLADSALIEILHNLIDNSIKYGKNLSKIRIYTQKTENQNTQLIYMDNGGGIDPKIKPQLFHKGAGKGTGLGLYLIQRICDIYYWRIHEEGNPGEGVRFVLEIPQDKTRKNVVY